MTRPHMLILSIVLTLGLMIYHPTRSLILFNLIPLALISIPIFAIVNFKKQGASATLTGIIVVSVLIHTYNWLTFGIYRGWDSPEFMDYATAFAHGDGLRTVVYRAPLYPLITGIIHSVSAQPLHWVVIFQHLLLILCVPLIYHFARLCDFSKTTGLIASLFFTLNTFTMRLSQVIMSETLFLFLLLCALVLFARLCKHKTILLAIAAGLGFALADHSRQLATPVFIATVPLLWFSLKTKKTKILLTYILTFIACSIPWSIHNQQTHGFYGLSSHLGTNIFTKCILFKLEDPAGSAYAAIQKPYENVLTDLKLANFEKPKCPEKRWDIMRVPSVLLDSLTRYHGLSSPEGGKLLTRAALEGFATHPAAYAKSVLHSLKAISFDYYELFPHPFYVYPVPSEEKMPLPIRYLVWGTVYIPGIFALFALVILLFEKEKKLLRFFPLAVLGIGYLSTALIHIGLTRYTVPWIPYLSLCGAQVIVFILEKTMSIRYDIKGIIPIRSGG